MSAVVRRIAVDRGPEQLRDFLATWSIESSTQEFTYRVKYRVDYPSVFHRGRGLHAQVVVERIEINIDGDWKLAQLTQGQRAAIVEVIEHEEELNAPLDGM